MQALRPVHVGLIANGDDFIAGVIGQRRGQVLVLPWKILVNKKYSHG